MVLCGVFVLVLLMLRTVLTFCTICSGFMDANALKTQSSIQIALTLECIWNLRNHVVHNNVKVNWLVEVKKLEVRILEHFLVLEKESSDVVQTSSFWNAPPPNCVKLNVDASLSVLGAVIVVARNSSGSIIQFWTKRIVSIDPCSA